MPISPTAKKAGSTARPAVPPGRQHRGSAGDTAPGRRHFVMAVLERAPAARAGRPGRCGIQPERAAWCVPQAVRYSRLPYAAQPVERDHVHGDDDQGPEWVGGNEEHLVIALSPITATTMDLGHPAQEPSLPELTFFLSLLSLQDRFLSGAVLLRVEQHEVAARGAFDPDGEGQMIIVILPEGGIVTPQGRPAIEPERGEAPDAERVC